MLQSQMFFDVGPPCSWHRCRRGVARLYGVYYYKASKMSSKRVNYQRVKTRQIVDTILDEERKEASITKLAGHAVFVVKGKMFVE